MLHRISLYWILTITFLLGSCGLGICVCVIHNQQIDFSILENYNPGLPSLVLDDEGNEWARFQLDRREPISLDAMPQHLIQAFIAAEDWSFFKHGGISWKGILRSTLINLYHGKIVQGASTITQQLVKLLFFDSRRTFKRKIKEQLYALMVEQQFTKNQILEIYLNHIYFGSGIYGVEAASQRFWAKHAADLTIEESAMLAAIVRSPGRYSPITCPLSAEKRRNVVLRLMQILSCISPAQYEQAKKMPLSIKTGEQYAQAPHARESLRIFLEERVGKVALYSGGLTIQTTLNKKMQEHAENCFKKQCTELKEKISRTIDGALVSIDVKTGGIKALVGGYDFTHSKFNRALQAKRQMGSTFKPLIYAQAVNAGMNFSMIARDEPIEIVQGTRIWQPKNAYQKFGYEMTLAYALSHSTNSIPIKLLLDLGYEPIIGLAKKCRLHGRLNPYPSLALGCVDVTPKEVVGMFNVFANDGVYVEPHLVKWVKDRWGTKIFKNTVEHERVLSSRTTGQVAKVLEIGLKRVHRFFPDQWLMTEGISKTGTTNDSRTCWYTGSTPELTTVVYIGCDDNSPMGKDIYPLTTAFPIWLSFMREIPAKQKKFVYDPTLQEKIVHEKTGFPMTSNEQEHSIAIMA